MVVFHIQRPAPFHFGNSTNHGGLWQKRTHDAPGFALCAGNAMVRIIRQNANVALSSTENRWAVTHSSLQVCMPTVQNGHGSCESLRTLFFEELRSFFHDLFIFLWLNAENLIQQSADGGIVNVHRAGQREHGEVVVRQRPNSLNQFPLRRIVKCDASATLPSTSSSARPMSILHSFFWRMQLQNELHICKVNATTNNVSGDQNVKLEICKCRQSAIAVMRA
mmetsp:Transcript_73850/g.163120  ORF Transcript_73850/g.163120 Transcript_73850/m.163120 type:complete len:222 (-) Transcript_73850:419-1084(-)